MKIVLSPQTTSVLVHFHNLETMTEISKRFFFFFGFLCILPMHVREMKEEIKMRKNKHRKNANKYFLTTNIPLLRHHHFFYTFFSHKKSHFYTHTHTNTKESRMKVEIRQKFN